MKRLFEIEYEDIFSVKTMANLKGKSGESLQQMLGRKNLNQALGNTMRNLGEIIQAEEEYRDELEMLAAQIVTDAFPIIDKANIKIDAKIVNQGDIEFPEEEGEEDPASPDFGDDDPEKLKAKRRIINGITQGASVRGAFSYNLFRDYLDQINPDLVEKYNEILKLVFGIYDDPNAIAMMLAMLAQGQKMSGGSSEMVYDEDEEQFVIKARAICFPMLVHEIVKGLYEIVGTQGFGMDAEKNKAIISAVDKLSNEPNDFRFGKFLYDAISDLYNQSNIEDARVRELFFAEVYKLNDDEFVPFIENAVNDELTPQQKKWTSDTMKDIEKTLKQEDTGLDEIFINMKHSELKEMIRGIVRERKLTAAEKKKKEDIVKGMKKSFKGDKASMYAIATAKAKKIAEVQGTELTQKIFEIGAMLKKVEAAMDFGIDQDPEVVKGLDQVYAELTNILNLIERDREAGRFVDENMINEGGDHEVAMAKNSLKSIAKATIELNQKLGNEERNIPGWIQDHIAKAENYIEQAAQGFHELKMEEKDPLDFVVAEKKGKDLTGPGGKPDGKIDSADYLKARDIAIKKAQAKKK